MNKRLVDLRSDTVTKPTPQMRKAMANAQVGDDVYRDDPTVIALEALFAQMLGKEAALFFPSGIMANQTALRTHCSPGSFVALGRTQHISAFEYGGAARNAGVNLILMDDSSGCIEVDDLAAAIDTQRFRDTAISLVSLENTHMASGGKVMPAARLAEIQKIAGHNVAIHVDGARLFNAQVATGVPAAALVSNADSVMCCVSKGLCAPVGSLLAGTRDFIEKARIERACLGGQMRQVGILAAAGIVALESMVERLGEDHERATRLWRAIEMRFGAAVAGRAPETNIVTFTYDHSEVLLENFRTAGVLGNAIAPKTLRLVTHNDIDDDDIEFAVQAIINTPDISD